MEVLMAKFLTSVMRWIANTASCIAFIVLGLGCLYVSAEVFYTGWSSPVRGLDLLSDVIQSTAASAILIVIGAALCIFGLEYIFGPLEHKTKHTPL
jgi:TRAP-type C4-dicarboxylate transport system permease small subunit